MSGIVGLYSFDGRLDSRDALAAMARVIAHRGPDGTSMWSKGPMGLGQLMLHATPESRYEVLPRIVAESDLVLTADARIDNRAELIQSLKMSRQGERPVTDSELIVAAYQKWGVRCPEHLIGDFAFVIWDEREQCFFCARDRMGIKPFYYHHQPGTLFCCASEIKALLSIDSVPREIDEVRVGFYLTRLADDAERTFYKGILNLPPGHTMTIRKDSRASIRQYWDLDPDREIRYSSDQAYVEAFLELFTQAVTCRMRSDSSSAVMLSGGLDSSSVACIARDELAENGEGPLQTFSAIFPDLDGEELEIADERHYVDALEKAGGIKAHRISLSRTSPLVDMERVLWHFDAPYIASNIYLPMSIYKAAKEHGISVVLDGAEGDIVVSHGVAYLGELAAHGHWKRFTEEAILTTDRAKASLHGWFKHSGGGFLSYHAEQGNWITFARGALAVSSKFDLSLKRVVWNWGVRPVIPTALRQLLRRGINQNQQGMPPIVASDLVRRTNLDERIRELNSRYTPKRFTAREAHWLNLSSGVGSIATILAEANHLAAACGIETRHPFYDARLIEYCLAIPPDQKLHQGWTRMILRKSMEGKMPDLVRWRTNKADLSPNFYRNLLQMESEQLRRLVQEELEPLEPYIDLDMAHEAFQRQDPDTLWTVLMLSQWLKSL